MLSDVSHDMLAQIVGSVFGTMMGMDVIPSMAAWRPDAERLTASVRISGNWNGALLFECDRAQACKFVGDLLAIDPPREVDESVLDALGELANIIGGNVKCALGSTLHLSLPSITHGSAHSAFSYNRQTQNSLAFDCPVGTFWVTLLASTS